MAMPTDTDKYEAQAEREAPHSAFQEFSRDERRPAVILLSALVLAAIFFAIGIMFGRWTAEPRPQPSPVEPAASTLTTPSPSPSPSSSPLPSASQQNANAQATAPQRTADDKPPRYTLLIADIKSKEAADSLARSLERAGYKDVRIQTRSNAPDSTLSVLIGRYTRDEAEAEAARLKKQGGPRTKNVRIVEAPAS